MTSLIYKAGKRAVDCIISVEDFRNDTILSVVKFAEASLSDNNLETKYNGDEYSVEVPLSKFV